MSVQINLWALILVQGNHLKMLQNKILCLFQLVVFKYIILH